MSLPRPPGASIQQTHRMLRVFSDVLAQIPSGACCTAEASEGAGGGQQLPTAGGEGGTAIDLDLNLDLGGGGGGGGAGVAAKIFGGKATQTGLMIGMAGALAAMPALAAGGGRRGLLGLCGCMSAIGVLQGPLVPGLAPMERVWCVLRGRGRGAVGPAVGPAAGAAAGAAVAHSGGHHYSRRWAQQF